MKILFCSNYFTHHQKPLAMELDVLTNHHFSFLGYKEMDAERMHLGWGNESIPDFVYNSHSMSSKENITDTDVLIVGSFPESQLRELWKNVKLVFRYQERPLKNGDSIIKYPIRFLRWHYNNPHYKNIYMLCASAFTAGDYRKYGLFRNRCYKWGYFPETRRYENIEDLFSKKSGMTLLWCGRFIDWKRPQSVIEVARQLKLEKMPFVLQMIGAGPEEKNLKQMVDRWELQDCVEFLGAMSPEKVRDKMECADIFLFTSDRKEGWGAVLNEAMNSGCAVIAAHEIGSAPYLIKNNENGLIYSSGETSDLFEKTRYLLRFPKEQKRLGFAAYHTIADLWNAEVAAKRLTILSTAILNGNTFPDLFSEGPCSRADIIHKEWYKK